MSTGPEHYALAEALLRIAGDWTPGVGKNSVATEALGHATLALVAASVESPAKSPHAWSKAIK